MPTSPVTPALDLSTQVHLGRPLSAHGLALVPLFPATEPLDFADLSQAVEAGTAEVQEQDSPTVPSLRVRNKADQPVLLVEGALLIGGLQDRIARKPAWVPGKAEAPVEVQCVEAHRWSARSGGRGFRAERAPADLRHARMKRRADQGETWRLVAEKRGRAGLHDGSGSLGESRDLPTVQRLERDLVLPWGACGVVVAWAHPGVSRWPVIEWMASPAAFRAAWPTIRRGVLDAHLDHLRQGGCRQAPWVRLSDVARLLAKVDRPAQVERHSAGPQATALRFTRGCMEGWATRVGQRLVHVGAVRS